METQAKLTQEDLPKSAIVAAFGTLLIKAGWGLAWTAFWFVVFIPLGLVSLVVTVMWAFIGYSKSIDKALERAERKRA